jgi:transformation/transcription domain-associated protein
MSDCKQLVKTLVVGIRSVVWSISNGRVPTATKGMSEEETLLAARLLKDGLKCFVIYNDGEGSKEEKEILEYFAAVFTVGG